MPTDHDKIIGVLRRHLYDRPPLTVYTLNLTQMAQDIVEALQKPTYSVKIRQQEKAECPFDGETFDPERDYYRLKGQLKRVYDVMKEGALLSYAEIAARTNDPEPSIAARIRDFRKMGLEVRSVNMGGGTWKYALSIPYTNGR